MIQSLLDTFTNITILNKECKNKKRAAGGLFLFVDVSPLFNWG
jgi:hypothetical protein